MYIYLSILSYPILSYPILSYPIHPTYHILSYPIYSILSYPSIYLCVFRNMYIIHHLCFLIPNSPKKKNCHAWPPWRFRPRWNLATGTSGPCRDLFCQSKEFPLDGQKQHVKIFHGKGASLAAIAHTSSAGRYQNQGSQCEKGKVRESWKSHPPIIVTPVAGGMGCTINLL